MKSLVTISKIIADTEAWKLLNHGERCAVYREGDKTKSRFKKNFSWIRNKQPSHSAQQDLAKHVNNKKRRKNARDTQRYRKRFKVRKM